MFSPKKWSQKNNSIPIKEVKILHKVNLITEAMLKLVIKLIKLPESRFPIIICIYIIYLTI